MGRRVQQPRQICYFADSPTLTYTYSGLTLSPLPWGSGAVAQVWILGLGLGDTNAGCTLSRRMARGRAACRPARAAALESQSGAHETPRLELPCATHASIHEWGHTT
jgi:hypothetical protein